MASSDDEGELVAHSVSNYHFVDDKDEPISFSVLPIQWSGDENLEFKKRQVFLHGTADDGLQKLYKQVKAWKFELSDEHPEISVLSKERNWIKLQKPRKSFEDIVRTILITVHCLGFVKKNPKILGRPLWDNLRKFFSTCEVWPSEKDLLDHISLIHDVVKRDEGVSKSKYLLTFLENPKKRTTLLEGVHSAPDTKKSKFIVDDEEEPPKDNDACAICDNGGELVCCDGRCLRSFHGTVAEGKDSHCQSLCLSKAQMKGTFMCANCRYKQHQCYACGKFGSSDQYIGAEVFPCVSATCGHFYHPECVAKLLYPGDESEAEKLQNKIAAGESFTCSAHRCHVCKKSENADFRGLCFALCRRCPKAYHRECLPRKIAFEDLDDEGIITRAWENLLPNNRVLIYCLKHKIDKRIGTPFRNIIFPNDERRNQTLDPQSNKRKVMEKGRSVITENEKDSEGKDDTKKRQKYLSEKGFDSSDKPKTKDISKKPIKDGLKSSMQLGKSGTTDASGVLLGEDKFPHKGPEIVKSNQQKISTSKFEKTIRHVVPLNKQSSPQSLTNAKTRTKIAALMEQIASSITLEEVVKNHKVPSTYASSLKNLQDRAITLGKVDVSVKAVRIALQKLEDGCSVEDAKAVCGPEILNQLIKWRNKLKVCLAPFLHGMRYTSFGRHFTKLDKLKEIVDKLHWYVQNDDVIVDFSCGANDFSWLMKEKLNETGKKCSFKNYDIIQTKNDFNFEKRDWFTVCLEDLPTGSKLIMGLNPPFGVKAALANKFIDKALEFEPKLLILIVPEETERLDKKEAAYDLIWEDDQKLSGKSFYLPGSVDVNDNQMDQWNVKPPLLYLWSRPDWTAEHMVIALKHGHLLKDEVEVHVEKNHDESEFHYPMDISPDHEDPIDISMLRKDHSDISGQINYLSEEQNETKPEESKSKAHRKWSKSSFPEHDTAANRNRYGYESTKDRNYHSVNRRPFKNPKVKNKGNPSGAAVTPPVGRNDHDLSPAMDTPTGTPAISSQHLQADAETLPEGRPYNQHGIPATGLDNETGYRGIRTSIQGGDFDRVARSNSSTPFASGTDGWSAGTRVGFDEYGIQGLDARTHYRRREPNEYGNNTDVQHLLQRYDQQNDSDYSAQRSHLHGLDSGFGTVDSLSSTPYGVPGLASNPTYGGRLSSLTMQRYAPHLDELNHRRIGPFGSETPVMSRSSIVDRIQNPPTTRTGFHPDSLGYASGTWRPFSYR